MFAKIFAQIFDSTIADDYRIRHVFEDLLKLADSGGLVDMTPEAIAARTRVPLDEIARALAALSAPDPRSRSRAEEGRRIVPLDPDRDWGWRIVNFVHYRGIRDEASRREYHRNHKALTRARGHAGDNRGQVGTTGDSGGRMVDAVDERICPQRPPMSTHTEAEAEAEAEEEAERELRVSLRAHARSEREGDPPAEPAAGPRLAESKPAPAAPVLSRATYDSGVEPPAEPASEPSVDLVIATAAVDSIPEEYARHYWSVCHERQRWVTRTGYALLWRDEMRRWWAKDCAGWPPKPAQGSRWRTDDKVARGAFWEATKRLELIEAELEAIRSRGTHGVGGLVIAKGDTANWLELRKKRDALKVELGLKLGARSTPEKSLVTHGEAKKP